MEGRVQRGRAWCLQRPVRGVSYVASGRAERSEQRRNSCSVASAEVRCVAEHGALCEGPCVNSTAQVDRGAGVRRPQGPSAGPSASAGLTRVASLRDFDDQEEQEQRERERETAARDTIECVELCGADSRLPNRLLLCGTAFRLGSNIHVWGSGRWRSANKSDR